MFISPLILINCGKIREKSKISTKISAKGRFASLYAKKTTITSESTQDKEKNKLEAALFFTCLF